MRRGKLSASIARRTRSAIYIKTTLAFAVIGEALVGTRAVGLLITGTVMGSVLFRLLVAIALRWGLSPNDLKLITAVFVFAALVLPNLVSRLKTGQTRRSALAKVA